MEFKAAVYGEEIERLLALDGSGNSLRPLVVSGPCDQNAHQSLFSVKPEQLFPEARSPKGALAGLWLYFSCFEEAHETAQRDLSVEGSYWHAILHRQEPDSGNAAYWFRRVGAHPILPALVEATVSIVKRHPEAEFRPSVKWDSFGFILFCERARQQPGSPSELAAMEIQRAEWQLLFDYCARSKS